MKKPVFAGIDDGFMEIKVVLLDRGVTLRIPSQIKAGEHNQINISGAATSVHAYATDEGHYLVGNLDETDSTKQDDYPVSAMNRVLVAHALREAGLTDGEDVIACSGLPVKRYYRGREQNRKLIKAKEANLMRKDVRAEDGTSVPRIVRHQVVSEAIAAWLDLVLKRKDGRIVADDDLVKNKTAIVDMGGRTVDIAVIQNYNLDMARSSTIEVGMLDVQDELEAMLTDAYGIEVTTVQLNQAMREGTMRVYGKTESVSELVERARAMIVPRIRTEVMRRLGSGSDIDQVVMCGGTAAALRHHLNDWFPHQVISEDPAFANARGMAKFAELVMGETR